MKKSTILIAHILLFGCVQALLVSLLIHKDATADVPTVVRIAFLPSEMVHSRLSPYGPGFDRELIQHFCRLHGLTPKWIRVKSSQKGHAALQNDRADLFIRPTAGDLPPLPADMRSGPVYRTGHPIIVHNKWKQGLLHPEDLCENIPLVASGPILWSTLNTLTRTLDCPSRTTAARVPGMDLLLSDMTADRTRFALVDASRFKLWQPFFPDIRPSLQLHRAFGPAWVWRTRHNSLAESLLQFWKDIPTSPFFLDLKARYFGFFPARTDFYELDHLAGIIARTLPRYSDTIKDAARKYELDPLLLTAMIYQESHFDPLARSKTGVRGLLQISRATAQDLGITNRLLPTASIMGGAAYLKSIMDRLEPMDLDPWNTLFFALGAYNQGLGHLRDAVKLTKKQGGDPHSWREVKKVFPLLSYRTYYTAADYGYCRGLEAVDYVESIRYYYYYLTGLLRLKRPAGKNLALLFPEQPAEEL